MSIVFAPQFPWPYLAILAALIVALGLYGLAHRVRGAILRMAALGLGVLALANPTIVREQRTALPDVVPIVVDTSPSQSIGRRTAQAEAALAQVRAALAGLPNLDLRVIRTGGDAADPGGGTRLFGALDRALADVPADRLAGILMLTDGEVHDAPSVAGAKARFPAPLHVLLTGAPDESDRRLMVVRAPRFGIIGEPVSLTVRVDDFGPKPTEVPALLSVTVDGENRAEMFVRPGQNTEVPIALKHGGASIVELHVAEGAHELTLANNRAALVINGVRDRLRVLLVSGEPNPGERTWRNLLRADPSVDLVHFTILRPPEKQDMTPIGELSLIAFPTRELFAEKLQQFDLVIFDRYRRRGVLPYAYFGNLTRYVEKGGGLMIVGGPEFATPASLYRTPLAAVLPVQPDGGIYTGPFRPSVTPLGRKHPVSSDLPGSGGGAAPGWGSWFRLIEGDAMTGQTLLSGPDDKPLLVLDRVGQGRVAEMMSDQAWLWARGFDGGGPQAELLRRLAHWLMKEPDLEEESLSAQAQGGRLTVTRRSLGDRVEPVTIVAPSGRSETADLTEVTPGRWQASVPAPEQGLYRLRQGDKTAMAAVGALDTVEFRDVRATPDKLAPLAAASGGSVRWLAQDGVPELRLVRGDRDTAGRGWIGLRANDRYIVRGIEQQTLIPLLVVLLAVLGGLLLAWLRESR